MRNICRCRAAAAPNITRTIRCSPAPIRASTGSRPRADAVLQARDLLSRQHDQNLPLRAPIYPAAHGFRPGKGVFLQDRVDNVVFVTRWHQIVKLEFYGIPNCDTVKKARKWLDGRGIDYTFHDYKKVGADP